MEPMILYFLPLLPWTKKALQDASQPLRLMLWRKKDKQGITWASWDCVATPKCLGGAALLNVDMHLMARSFSASYIKHGNLLYKILLRMMG